MRFRNFAFFAFFLLAACKPAIADKNAGIIQTAEKYLYVREEGNNRSPDIDRWNTFCKVPLGSYWCASFVAFVHHEAGIKAIRSAWSPSWFTADHRIPFEDLAPGDCVGFYYPNLGRIGHIGLFTGVRRGAHYITIEGNTGPSDSYDQAGRNGQGVYKKLRNGKLLGQERNKFSRWK